VVEYVGLSVTSDLDEPQVFHQLSPRVNLAVHSNSSVISEDIWVRCNMSGNPVWKLVPSLVCVPRCFFIFSFLFSSCFLLYSLIHRFNPTAPPPKPTLADTQRTLPCLKVWSYCSSPKTYPSWHSTHLAVSEAILTSLTITIVIGQCLSGECICVYMDKAITVNNGHQPLPLLQGYLPPHHMAARSFQPNEGSKR
jgi:hypothetical protein